METIIPKAEYTCSQEKIWSVSEISQEIKSTIDKSFNALWITGEVTDLTIHRSGHVYFSLKDGRSQIRVVYFRGAVLARQLRLKDGIEVDAYGKLTVYELRSNYQLKVEYLRTKGIGKLQLRFEQLKQQLHMEGLFSEKKKRNIPSLPRCIGVITSPDGAALHDFLRVIDRRFSSIPICIYPAIVQGEKAPETIIKGIDFFHSNKKADVLVLMRGGGSIEDLWAFNDESLARTIAGATIPIISAIGHEVDYTICDFVADLRVPTPSAAAEQIVSGRKNLLRDVANLEKRLSQSVRLQISLLHTRLEKTFSHYLFKAPGNTVEMFQQRVDELRLRLSKGMERTLEKERERICSLHTQLSSLNPQNVLSRGYAILLSETTNKLLRDPHDAQPGDVFRGILEKGTVYLTTHTKLKNCNIILENL